MWGCEREDEIKIKHKQVFCHEVKCQGKSALSGTSALNFTEIQK